MNVEHVETPSVTRNKSFLNCIFQTIKVTRQSAGWVNFKKQEQSSEEEHAE